VNTIRHQLKQKGNQTSLDGTDTDHVTQKAVTTTAVNKPGERVAFRNCTLPESKIAEIYDALNYQHQPFKRRKICTPKLPARIFILLYGNKFGLMRGKLG
jgi:hypothetical protein